MKLPLQISSRNWLKAFAALVLFASGPVSAEAVYVRNQRLPVEQADGAPVVQLDAFRALLTPQERGALKLEGTTLTVRNAEGQSKGYKVTSYGELVEWQELLLWLGYHRRQNDGTGVVDFVNSSAGEASVGPWKAPTSEVLASRKESSLRRAGYKMAQKNFDLVMAALGQGGTESDRQRVARLGYQIADKTPLAEVHWTFEVAKTPIPNALCTGEGFVVVTEGLLALNLTDDELAGVLGHEIAHGVRRHAMLYEERFMEARRLAMEIRSLEQDAYKADEEHDNHRLQTIRSRVNAMAPRLEFVIDFLRNKQSYDQHEEEEADVQGMHYAVAAGFDPSGEGRALIKLRARSVQMFGQAYQEGSRTHPPLERRLEILTLVQKRWQASREK